ncbi:hypothetical protein I7I53_08626 [Histoplasma capsulatum var. duboisii H88]|uniref:Uncharacterized protein n=1 Tax=Ajellomyces capsulatus (strain H88) TaxID=544711 RepID=A0A8A1LFM8_AJEC8|nr:hypothetical protein I7I53_08626 [Histoplasma capsulatum var. duboisii H88]
MESSLCSSAAGITTCVHSIEKSAVGQEKLSEGFSDSSDLCLLWLQGGALYAVLHGLMYVGRKARLVFQFPLGPHYCAFLLLRLVPPRLLMVYYGIHSPC